MESDNLPDNPLLSETAAVWNELIQGVEPASLLVLIDMRMSASLRHRTTAEDILQESLLCAWRDRRQCEWRGMRSFRAWLLAIIDHRIRDAAERESAAKRRVTGPMPATSPTGSSESGLFDLGPVASTTPSRIAIYREQAAAMHEALDALSEELRSVVRLRLFEQRSMSDVAQCLGISLSAARHRFYKGAEIYQRRLTQALATRSETLARLSVQADTACSNSI